MAPPGDALDTFAAPSNNSNVVWMETGAEDTATGYFVEKYTVDTMKPPPNQVASASVYLVNPCKTAGSLINYPSTGPPSQYTISHSSCSSPISSNYCSFSSLLRPLNDNTSPIVHRRTHTSSDSQYGRTPAAIALQKPRCWDHGCGGRTFSSIGNYRRHLREQNRLAPAFACPICGKLFTRSTARKLHQEMDKCWAGADLD
jgi:hypothetical protein